MTCQVCEQRKKEEAQAAKDCNKQVQLLQAKSNRLAIFIAVLATLIGKETFDQVVEMFNAVEALISIKEPVNQPALASSHNHLPSPSRFPKQSVLFANVPALTPALAAPEVPIDFMMPVEQHALLPEPNNKLFLAALWALKSDRKRK